MTVNNHYQRRFILKKLPLLIPMLILVITCSKDNQQQNITFNTSIGGTDKYYGTFVQQTSDGGFIITGDTKSYGEGSVVLLKTDVRGKKEWLKTFGGSEQGVGEFVQQTSDGGYAVVGSIENSILLLKTDSFGNKEWSKTFKKDSINWGNSVQQTTDGGYVVLGVAWLIKTDFMGGEEWNKTLGVGSVSFCSIRETLDGGFILTGHGESEHDVLLFKTDGHGNKAWEQTFGGSGYEHGREVQQTSDGGYVIFGFTDIFSQEGSKVWLIKTDAEGIEEWDKTFKYGGSDYGRSGQQTYDGGFIIGVDSYSYGAVFNKDVALLLKTNSLGEEEWVRVFEDCSISSVRQTLDGGYVIAGWDSSKDLWLAKTDSSGRIPQK